MDVSDAVRNAVTAYYAAVTRGDIEAVSAMFAPDAVMRDPVGTPAATDPAARAQRYGVIAAIFAEFVISDEHVIVCGDEAAAKWIARATTQTGRDVSFEGISIFVFDTERKITSMSVYFDTAALANALQP